MKIIAVMSMLAMALVAAVGVPVCISLISDFIRRRSAWDYDLSFVILLIACILGIACVFVHTFYHGIIILME